MNFWGGLSLFGPNFLPFYSRFRIQPIIELLGKYLENAHWSMSEPTQTQNTTLWLFSSHLQIMLTVLYKNNIFQYMGNLLVIHPLQKVKLCPSHLIFFIPFQGWIGDDTFFLIFNNVNSIQTKLIFIIFLFSSVCQL